ncbi:lasso peptide biosynthesis PqqD family chaperone [Gorillibacterium timonense]|uniref:lasso peptide biosynthesis PqqD family chaperone n=1 Tax=Gorillibacterium timonense TaxID=1689269 RepID=UPI00071C8030|nr:lasso peptide biosynthesis PqqD family chaperone [Gorillibacterium timonense]
MMNSSPVLPRTVLKQVPGHIVSVMDGETVMLSVQNGKYYNLGEIGGAIWNELAQPIAFEELVERLTAEYEVEPEECSRQVLRFVDMLRNEGLVAEG